MITYNPLIINKKKCQKLLLTRAEARWGQGKMTRVQAAVYLYLDTLLRGEIHKFVNQHPTKGKTLMIETRKRKETEV
jgi:hypothetical protein